MVGKKYFMTENGVYESGRRSFNETYKDGNKEKKE